MRTLAPRFECKYCVPVTEAENVLRVARVFLDVDRAAWPDARTDGPVPVQRITSLYLDSPARTFLGWHVARQTRRFKLRLRRYSAGQCDVTWAEVKHKIHGRVVKTRGRLPNDVVGSIEGDNGAPEDLPGGDAALDDFVARQRAYGARPQVLLQCDRRGLRGSGFDRAEGVTVDVDLGYYRGPRVSLADVLAPGAWVPLALPWAGPEPAAIVELKHGGRPPAWMRGLMSRLAPWQCSFSKYLAAMHAVARLEGGR